MDNSLQWSPTIILKNESKHENDIPVPYISGNALNTEMFAFLQILCFLTASQIILPYTTCGRKLFLTKLNVHEKLKIQICELYDILNLSLIQQ